MDWGSRSLSEEQRFRVEDNNNNRPEAFIRIGSIGADQVREDDDVILIISPQNGKGSFIVLYCIVLCCIVFYDTAYAIRSLYVKKFKLQ
jgi:hypothetical protein